MESPGLSPAESCPLSLKIMRLARPTFYGSPVVEAGEPGDGPLGVAGVARGDQPTVADVTRVPALPHVQSGELLLLPKSFGDIHQGETFCCYVSVFNSGASCVRVLAVSSELQTEVRRRSLTPVAGSALPASCEPRQHVGAVFRHEVTEVGSHMLVCTVSYSDCPRRSFHQRFKFEAKKPLDLKTKFRVSAGDATGDARLRLEATVANTSALPMLLERVSLAPAPGFSLAVDVAGPAGLALAPRDVVQLVFQLKSAGTSTVDAGSVVGKLEVQWSRALGLRGRLQFSLLLSQPPAGPGDLVLRVLGAPGAARCLQPLVLQCELSNRGARELCLQLSLREFGAVVWRGRSGQRVASLAPGERAPLTLELELREPGLHCVGGVTLVDAALGIQFPFNQLTEVLAL